MNVAIVGVTGLVGRTMLRVLEERNFPVSKLIPIASARSKGRIIDFKNKGYTITTLEDLAGEKIDLALFSAGGKISKLWAPKMAAAGTVVIDNSSTWRMDTQVPLIVPEVNAAVINKGHKLIANPNCSTIQLVVALGPLHDSYQVNRLVVSTYQSMTGTGKKALDQYEMECAGQEPAASEMAYAHPIFENCLPHCDVFLQNDYTKEEMKLVHETRKILGDDDMKITATAVRVPVKGGHSESVNVTFKNDFDIPDVKQKLRQSPGVIVVDDPDNNDYPYPLLSKDKDEVFIGRIRRDESIDNGLNLFIVADNLRKGAATNSIQIAEYMLDQGFL